MKALVLALVLVTVGDLVVDHGAGVRAVGRAGAAFVAGFRDAFDGSLFAA